MGVHLETARVACVSVKDPSITAGLGDLQLTAKLAKTLLWSPSMECSNLPFLAPSGVSVLRAVSWFPLVPVMLCLYVVCPTLTLHINT